MKDDLHELCATAETPLMAQHLVREYLQARILQSLQWSSLFAGKLHAVLQRS